MKSGILPRRPAKYKSFRIPYFQVVSYAFSRSKKYRDNVVSTYKTVTNCRFYAHELVSSTAAPSKATLGTSYGIVGFKEPNQAGIYHSFKCLAQAASKGNRSVVCRFCRILTWLSDGNDGGFPPGSWKVAIFPYTVENI